MGAALHQIRFGAGGSHDGEQLNAESHQHHSDLLARCACGPCVDGLHVLEGVSHGRHAWAGTYRRTSRTGGLLSSGPTRSHMNWLHAERFIRSANRSRRGL
jgi:hypothetical protein